MSRHPATPLNRLLELAIDIDMVAGDVSVRWEGGGRGPLDHHTGGEGRRGGGGWVGRGGRGREGGR